MTRPGIGQRLEQSQQLSLAMQPRMLQSILLLQMPALELDAFLRDAFESNEALVLEERGPRGTAEDSEKHDRVLQEHPAPEAGLVELVAEQLVDLDVEPERAAWVRLLVECLDERGYLSVPDERLLELAAERGLAPDAGALGAAIATLQTLEPRGIGARDAVEALLLQLDPRGPDYALLCRLLEEFLDAIARNKLPKVAKALGVDLERLDELLGELRVLDPRPAASLVSSAAPELRPDVVVERTDGGFEVRVEGSGFPAVSIDEGVRAMAADRGLARDVRSYLRGKLEQARWIVDAVEQRRETLARVATVAFAHQRAFLEHGPGHLVPLRMGAVADTLGLHVSTVSRACAGKYAWTPHGVVALRALFGGAAGASETTVRDDVREAVRRTIEAEDPAAPLSDEGVVAALARRGLAVARRTVAKYRGELDIPSSYRRRKYA